MKARQSLQIQIDLNGQFLTFWHKADEHFMLPRHDEENYLDQIRKILKDGSVKDDRTGTGTKSIFGMQARYSLRGNVKIHIIHLRFHGTYFIANSLLVLIYPKR